jgi:uncharacterized membrane protein
MNLPDLSPLQQFAGFFGVAVVLFVIMVLIVSRNQTQDGER